MYENTGAFSIRLPKHSVLGYGGVLYSNTEAISIRLWRRSVLGY